MNSSEYLTGCFPRWPCKGPTGRSQITALAALAEVGFLVAFPSGFDVQVVASDLEALELGHLVVDDIVSGALDAARVTVDRDARGELLRSLRRLGHGVVV